MPVGPHILWPEATIQSAPSACTSTAWLGTDWQQSSSSRAPTARAISATRAAGSVQPSMLLTWTRETRRVRGVMSSASCAMSSSSVSRVKPTNLGTNAKRTRRGGKWA